VAEGSEVGASFSERLNELLATTPDPATGRSFSVRKVARELTTRGYSVSHTYLKQLLDDKAPPPRVGLPEAIAQVFGRPGYFNPPAGTDRDQDEVQVALRRALSDPAIRQVAMFLADGEPLSPEGAKAVLAMIEHVKMVEAAARQRGSGHARPPQDTRR
jgi:hypothetical protein